MSAAQDWVVKNNEDGNTTVRITAIDGLGELYVMIGNTPEEVVSVYHSKVIGRVQMPPQWALGWGWDTQYPKSEKDASVAKSRVKELKDNGVPIENIFIRNYEDAGKEFTIGKLTNLTQWTDELRSLKMHVIPLFRQNIAYRPSD